MFRQLILFHKNEKRLTICPSRLFGLKFQPRKTIIFRVSVFLIRVDQMHKEQAALKALNIFLGYQLLRGRY